MKVTYKFFAGLLTLIVACLAFIYFSPGYDLFFIHSESMKPSLNLGDLVVTGPVKGLLSPEIKSGTIITYKQGKDMVTHRVLSIKGNTLITKGDANEDPDPAPVQMSDIVGIYLFKIPFIGFLVNFTHTKLGWFLIILVPTFILLSLLIKDILKEAFISDSKKAEVPNKELTKTGNNKVFHPKSKTPPKNENDAYIRNLLLELLREKDRAPDMPDCWRYQMKKNHS